MSMRDAVSDVKKYGGHKGEFPNARNFVEIGPDD